jgi:hypothetical protein
LVQSWVLAQGVEELDEEDRLSSHVGRTILDADLLEEDLLRTVYGLLRDESEAFQFSWGTMGLRHDHGEDLVWEILDSRRRLAGVSELESIVVRRDSDVPVGWLGGGWLVVSRWKL